MPGEEEDVGFSEEFEIDGVIDDGEGGPEDEERPKEAEADVEDSGTAEEKSEEESHETAAVAAADAGDAIEEAVGGGSESPPEAPPESASEAPAKETVPQLDGAELRRALEAVLFSVSEPITIRALAELFGQGVHEIRAAVDELQEEYARGDRAFAIEDIAGGVQMLTLSRFDPWVRRLRQKEREGKLSAAALETLAVIAYKQPINKGDLESIRGVGCTPILKTLLERALIKVVGRDESLGRPLLYGTTRRFLESFGLPSLRDLPQPEELMEKLESG